jgi:putative transposase
MAWCRKTPIVSNSLHETALPTARNSYSESPVRLIFFSESSLQYAIDQYLEHYHEERNHQDLESKILRPGFDSPLVGGAAIRKERLGGLLNF